MSDDTLAAPAAAADAEVSADAEQAEAEAPPAREYLDTDEYADRYVRVRVDGEDLEVPLSEALGGYSRTADYTRKTQQLAEQQRDAQFALTLHRALENNPVQTLQILRDQYGLGPDLQPVQAEQQLDEDLDYDDPVVQRVLAIEARQQELDQYQAQQELAVACRVLHQRYGDDFNPQEVVARAAQLGRMDLEGVYKEMAFERYWTQQQAQQQATQQRQQEDQARNAAKANLGVQVGGSANAELREMDGNAPTLADAYYEAKRQLGM